MVRISRATVIRANERTIAKYRNSFCAMLSDLPTDGIKVETSVNGRSYSLALSEQQINDAFGRVMKKHK